MKTNLLRAHGTTYRYQRGNCRCAACGSAQADYNRRYYKEHREECRVSQAAYHVAHREEIRTRQTAYHRANAATLAAKQRQYRGENIEKCRAAEAAYSAAHRGDRAAKQAAYRLEHPTHSEDYRMAHLEQAAARSRNRRALASKAPGSHTADDVSEQLERQRGRCYWCRKAVGKKYHVDHVTPLLLGGSNGPENLVVSCPRCNLKKKAKHPMDFAGMLC